MPHGPAILTKQKLRLVHVVLGELHAGDLDEGNTQDTAEVPISRPTMLGQLHTNRRLHLHEVGLMPDPRRLPGEVPDERLYDNYRRNASNFGQEPVLEEGKPTKSCLAKRQWLRRRCPAPPPSRGPNRLIRSLQTGGPPSNRVSTGAQTAERRLPIKSHECGVFQQPMFRRRGRPSKRQNLKIRQASTNRELPNWTAYHVPSKGLVH